MANKKSKRIITTIKIPFKCDDGIHDNVMELRLQQSILIRRTYKLLSDDNTISEVKLRNDLKRYVEQSSHLSSMDAWFIQSAIYRAKAMASADEELRKDKPYYKRIHGGKKNLKKRYLGNITNEEWKVLRTEDLTIEGEAPQKGNRKVEFHNDHIILKPKKGIKYRLDFDVLQLRGKYGSDYHRMIKYANDKKIAIKVAVSNNFIYLSVDNDKLDKFYHSDNLDHFPNRKQIKHNTGNYVGIDCNPNNYGVVYYRKDGTVISSEVYNLKNLTGRNINHGKLTHETREIAWAIIRKCEHYKIDYVFSEDLSFAQGNKGKGRNYNRLCSNQFLFNECLRIIGKKLDVRNVNAAYSSTIGNLMHSDCDPIAAAKEVARRGKAILDKNYDEFYPEYCDEYLENYGTDISSISTEDQEESNSWIIVHNWLKNTGLRYRTPLPTDGFKNYASYKSKVTLFVTN